MTHLGYFAIGILVGIVATCAAYFAGRWWGGRSKLDASTARWVAEDADLLDI